MRCGPTTQSTPGSRTRTPSETSTGTSPAADQTEVEIITNQTGEGSPSGTSMGTATLGDTTYDVYYTYALKR